MASWLAGMPMAPSTIRSALADLLTRVTTLPERLLPLLRDPKTGKAAEPFDAADALVARLPDNTWRTIALPSREDRATVATVMLEWWLGGRPLWSGSTGEEAVGLGEATPQELLGRSLDLEASVLIRWLQADHSQLAAALDWWRTIGIGAMHEMPDAVRAWTDAETIRARDDIVAWRALWSGWAELIPQQHGDALLEKLISTADAPLDETAILACVLVAARRSGFGPMLDVILGQAHVLVSATESADALSPDARVLVRAEMWQLLQAGPPRN